MDELNQIIHQAVRLRIMAALTGLDTNTRVDFTALRDFLHVTDGNLGAHLRKLEDAADPDAIIAARKNARSNNVTDRLMLVQGSLLALRLRANYRMTVVNLLSRQIIAFLNLGLTQTIAPGGIMILAGILEEQELEVRSAIQNSGMKLLASEKAPDTGFHWARLARRERPPRRAESGFHCPPRQGYLQTECGSCFLDRYRDTGCMAN